MGMYYILMLRAATTTDVFNASAESRRRDMLILLAGRERSVGDIVEMLGLEQPSVPKHLRVLRDVDLVRARRDGRQMLYRTAGRPKVNGLVFRFPQEDFRDSKSNM